MTATPPAASEPPAGSRPRTCPRCEAPLGPEQDWCLNCGLAVTTRIERPPSWRAPLAAIAGLALVGLAVIALAFFALADDDPGDDPAATTPAPAEQTPPAEPVPEETATPEETPVPEETPAPDAVASWPEGERAWTIVLNSTASRSAAERRAREFGDRGIDAGVLRSNDFSSLRPGFWVVFSGQYESSRAAAAAQRQLGSAAPASAYVREVVPR